MRRRRFFQSVAAVPALPAAAQYGSSSAASGDLPKLAETAPDGAADSVRRFFTPDQSAALGRLAELLVPKSGARPGAAEAGAASFLDFLIQASPAPRQALYRGGLDRLNAEAQRRFRKGFASLTTAEAAPIIEPLSKPWTYQAPTDAFARFLREAKDDILQATVSSREYAEAASGRRAGAATNAYWLPLD